MSDLFIHKFYLVYDSLNFTSIIKKICKKKSSCLFLNYSTQFLGTWIIFDFITFTVHVSLPHLCPYFTLPVCMLRQHQRFTQWVVSNGRSHQRVLVVFHADDQNLRSIRTFTNFSDNTVVLLCFSLPDLLYFKTLPVIFWVALVFLSHLGCSSVHTCCSPP